MQELEQGLSIIRNFNTLPKEALEALKSDLGLRMRSPELAFCASHYKGKSGNHISIGELRFIDAIACPAHTALSKISVSKMLTDEPYAAETFQDAISKLNVLGKEPEQPITLQDLADLPCRYLHAFSGKQPNARIGIRSRACAQAAAGFSAYAHIDTPQGGVDLLRSLPVNLLPQAKYADAIMLIRPAIGTPCEDYGALLRALLGNAALCKHLHCIADCTHTSIAHAVLAYSNGATVNIAQMPQDEQHVMALTENGIGNLLMLSQDAIALVNAKAAEIGLSARCLGIVDHAGDFTVKNGKDTLLCFSASYLKTICFIRGYSLRVERESCTYDSADPYLSPLEMRIPAAVSHKYAATYASICQDPYHRALACVTEAYCAAVAQGHRNITVHTHLQFGQCESAAHTFGQAFAALLGIYRFSMETLVPVCTETKFCDQTSNMLALTSADADATVAQTLQGQGKIYLLRPLCDANGIVDYNDLCKLIAYLRHMISKGQIKAARALCGMTPAQVLEQMSQGACGVVYNPDQSGIMASCFPGAFIVESTHELEGDLIAASTLPIS